MTGVAAVIGGGVIGGGWAARFALMGWQVRVFDPDPEAARKLDAVLANARYALPMLYDAPMPSEGAIIFCETLREAVQGADWVQESVPERLDLKRAVYDQIGAQIGSGEAVVASSTSGFKPSELQQGQACAAQMLVAHPFNPVYLLPLAELVPGQATTPAIIARAQEILTGIGMIPLHIRAEIDAHVADRFLEAVWREALWLVKDGIATTQEIDDAIRYGFGLRWAQMGLFETYRVAGGEAGMRHFMAQFGPALQWPWTRLTDVPEFDDALVDLIAGQSDAQSGHLSIRQLERQRDENLVAMMRALKGRGAAAGAVLNRHEAALRPASRDAAKDAVPMITVRRSVPIDWTDANGHMNEGRYGQVFSDAADEVLRSVGAGQAYIDAGHSYFTAETNIKYLGETLAAEAFFVETRVGLAEGKKLRLLHEMKRAEDGVVLARCDQFLLHVSLQSRKSCPPLPAVAEALARLKSRHEEVA